MDWQRRFLECIRQHPGEDAPRLVYADWLDECGDPRGEFIRIQCELAKLPHRDGAAGVRLERREKQLAKRYQQDWLRSLEGFGIREARFERGFLCEADLSYQSPDPEDSSGLSKRWEWVIASEPALTKVALFLRQDWNDVRHLRRASQLRELHVTHQRLERREISVLLRWPLIEGIDRLDLSHNNLRSGVECVARAPGLNSVRELDLSFNRVGSRGAKALVSSPFLRSLAFLNLRGNHIGRGGKQILRDAFGPRVQL